MNFVVNILVLSLVYLVQGVVLQNDNCANNFKYINDNGRIRGQIEIRNPPIVPTILLKLKLQVSTRLSQVKFVDPI